MEVQIVKKSQDLLRKKKEVKTPFTIKYYNILENYLVKPVTAAQK